MAAAAALVLSASAAAQGDGSMRRAMAADLAGDWQIVPVDGSPVCALSLTLAPARGGWLARMGSGCDAVVPAMARTVGWTFENGMRLLDAMGNTVMRFEEDDTALPTSPSLAEPRFYLVPAITGFARLRQPGEWAGAWQVVAKGQKPCILQFGPLADPAAPRAGGPVTARRCPARVLARMNRWTVEGMRLLLSGPGDALIAFAPDGAQTHRSDDGRWRLGYWQGAASRRR